MKKTASKSSTENLFKQIKICSGQNKMLEAAVVMSQVRTLGYSPDDIIKKLKQMKCKISKPHVYNLLKLAGVPEKVKNHINKGNIKASEVLVQMHKHQEPSELIKLIEKCVEDRKRNLESKRIEILKKIDEQKKIKFRKKLEHEAEKYGYNLDSPVIQNLLGLTGSNKKQISTLKATT